MKMPVLFVGHGSPTNALEDNRYTQALGKLGKEMPRPKAILSISAHWLTRGTKVLVSDKPNTIHDFYGFPPELFQVQYPASGAPDEAKKIAKELGFETDETWGLDHGTWSVLKHMYPKADIPVFQLSLDQGLKFKDHMDLGKKLQTLRERGILILGSGNLTHNLGEIIWDPDAKPADWAREFDEKAKKVFDEGKREVFTDPQDYFGAALFRKNHPSTDHYLPLLYVLGASPEKDDLSYPYEGFEYGSLSMRMVRFG